MSAATTRRIAMSPADMMRAILMDFGFAGLIEKIEEYCGKHVTRALMWALVFAAFALTLRLGVESLATVSAMITSGTGDWWSVADDILILAVAVLAACAVVATTISRYGKRKAREELSGLYYEARSMHENNKKLFSDWEHELREAEQEAKRRILEEAKRQGIFPKKNRGNPDA